MQVYMICGFFGSGKTALLVKLASMCKERGAKVAILVNVSGEANVDGITLEGEGCDTMELPDGCICCTLAEVLESSLKNIKKDIDPDIIFIEPSGLAQPHRVKEVVKKAMIRSEEIYIISIVDVQRFEGLVKKREALFKQQMSSADLILINMCDLATPAEMEATTEWLRTECPSKPVIPISTKTGENLDKVYEMIK